MRNTYIISAGFLYLLAAIGHTVLGHGDSVAPLLGSALDPEIKSQWLGMWNLITVLLWCIGFLLTKNGFNYEPKSEGVVSTIATLSVVFSVGFIATSIYTGHHSTQYIYFLAGAVIIFLGMKKANRFAGENS